MLGKGFYNGAVGFAVLCRLYHRNVEMSSILGLNARFFGTGFYFHENPHTKWPDIV